ncbi:MAG: RrF2 family transcriptional regulator [Candidatus Binataceae bacterium]
MQLTYYTDYGLRVLVYAGVREGRLCLISEIAQHYGISENHLMKVVHGLAQGGFVRTYRGKGGGLTLARDPLDIVIGAVVRHMEGPFKPVECFHAGNQCAISGACELPNILGEAFQAFAAVLDRYTLAAFLERRTQLARRLFAPRGRGGKVLEQPVRRAFRPKPRNRRPALGIV